MVLNLSCPAVSQICSLTSLLSTMIFLILKSMLQRERGRGEGREALRVRAWTHSCTRACQTKQHAQARCSSSPNGCDEAGGEGVLGEAQQQATLAHACVCASGQ